MKIKQYLVIYGLNYHNVCLRDICWIRGDVGRRNRPPIRLISQNMPVISKENKEISLRILGVLVKIRNNHFLNASLESYRLISLLGPM
jgi:hypothetical protein